MSTLKLLETSKSPKINRVAEIPGLPVAGTSVAPNYIDPGSENYQDV
jgi:hypothetical protein